MRLWNKAMLLSIKVSGRKVFCAIDTRKPDGKLSWKVLNYASECVLGGSIAFNKRLALAFFVTATNQSVSSCLAHRANFPSEPVRCNLKKPSAATRKSFHAWKKINLSFSLHFSMLYEYGNGSLGGNKNSIKTRNLCDFFAHSKLKTSKFAFEEKNLNTPCIKQQRLLFSILKREIINDKKDFTRFSHPQSIKHDSDDLISPSTSIMMMLKQNQMKKQIQIICLSHHFPICWNKEWTAKLEEEERKATEHKYSLFATNGEGEFCIHAASFCVEHEDTIITSSSPPKIEEKNVRRGGFRWKAQSRDGKWKL